jgi:hypothetical protein
MTESSEPRPEPKGHRFTLVGLVVVIVMIGVLAAIFVVALINTKERASRDICGNNLSQMYKAMHVYRHAFGGNKNYMPHTGDAFFTCLLGHSGSEHPPEYATKAPMLGNKDCFVCCYSGHDETSVMPGGAMADYKGPSRHPLVPPGNPSALVDGIPPDYPIACDKPGNHKEDGGGKVLRFDGSVSFLEGDAYQAAVKACSD